MGLIFSGDGDVNYTGVVGSSEGADRETRRERDDDTHDAHEGIVHTGIGEVRINGRRQG